MLSSTTTKSPSTNSQPSPLTTSLHQSVTILKQQLRQQRQKVISLTQQHKQQIYQLNKQISSLKQHILQMRQKQYINQLMGEQQQQSQRQQLLKLRQQHHEFKKRLQKQQKQLLQYKQIIQTLQQQNIQQKSTLTLIQRQKQKHLQISITQKINLQTKIQLIQKQLLMKQSIIKKFKDRQIQVQKMQQQNNHKQKLLNKQLNQVEIIKKQMQKYNSFEIQKIKQQFGILQKENHWLRQHIEEINHSQQFIDKKNNKNNHKNTFCTNSQCQQQIQSYKNKFIQKSRQLAKLKTQLTKGLFKEKFSSNTNKEDKENYLNKTKLIGNQKRQGYQSFNNKSQELKFQDHSSTSTQYINNNKTQAISFR